mmetsp:Transcript_103507/g.309233  ORF Transcript_103507/g.309233 Transcript_103507/m.309233 type:complete len:272 (-) Transcript_103507:168-983(-)
MGLPKELISGGIVFAGILQAILNSVSTFAVSWTSCSIGPLKLEWGLQSCTFMGNEMEYDTQFTNTMAQVSKNFGSFMMGCRVIEVGNIIAMGLGLMAALAGGLGGSVAEDMEATGKAFKGAMVLFSLDAVLRIVGVVMWVGWIMPAIGELNLMEPFKQVIGDFTIPFVQEISCNYHQWEVGLNLTAIEIILLFNAAMVVGLMGKPSARVVMPPAGEAVQMMSLGQPGAPGMPGMPGPYGVPPPGGMSPAGGIPAPYGMPPNWGQPAYAVQA